jgi:two-component sensor histidine kinase
LGFIQGICPIIFFRIDEAVPCGMILCELLSNALKYAFPGTCRGEVKITVRRTEGNEIELVVKDNGIGLPEDLDLGRPETLGLRIVSLLAENQLEGSWAASNDEGACVSIRWKASDGKNEEPKKMADK